MSRLFLPLGLIPLQILVVAIADFEAAYLVGGTSNSLPEFAPPLRRLGASEFRLTSKDGFARPFCFTPDGKKVAGANWDEVRMWSFPEGTLLHDFSDRINSRCIAFSADGREFLALEQREMAVYHFAVETGKLIKKVKLADVVQEMGLTRYWLSADGRWLCTTGVHTYVTVWDTTTGERRLRMQRMQPYSAPVIREGILTLWDNLLLLRFSIETGEQLKESRIYRRLLSPLSNSEGTLMAAYSTEDQAIVFWDPATGERVGGQISTGEREWRPEQAALSADGKRFVYWISNGKMAFARRMAVFDVATGKLISVCESPDTWFMDSPIISPNGKYAFLSGSTSVFTVIDCDTGKKYHDTPDHAQRIGSLSFTPDGHTLLVGSMDKRRAWNVDTGKPGIEFEPKHQTPEIVAVDDNRAILTGVGDAGLWLQNISTGEIEQRYLQDTNANYSDLQLSGDRKSFVVIAIGREERVIRQIDIATGKEITVWQMPANATEEEGRATEIRNRYLGLVLGGSRLYRLDQVQAPTRLSDKSIDWGRTDLLLEDWINHQVTNRFDLPGTGLFVISNSSDCTVLAAGVSDEWHLKNQRGYGPGSTYLSIWDLKTGKEQIRVERERDDYFSSFSCVAVSAGGRLAATVTHQSEIEVWNGFTGEVLQSFDAKNRVLTLKFSDDGSKLASGHLDGIVYLWDTLPAWDQVTPQ